MVPRNGGASTLISGSCRLFNEWKWMTFIEIFWRSTRAPLWNVLRDLYSTNMERWMKGGTMNENTKWCFRKHTRIKFYLLLRGCERFVIFNNYSEKKTKILLFFNIVLSNLILPTYGKKNTYRSGWYFLNISKGVNIHFNICFQSFINYILSPIWMCVDLYLNLLVHMQMVWWELL